VDLLTCKLTIFALLRFVCDSRVLEVWLPSRKLEHVGGYIQTSLRKVDVCLCCKCTVVGFLLIWYTPQHMDMCVQWGEQCKMSKQIILSKNMTLRGPKLWGYHTQKIVAEVSYIVKKVVDKLHGLEECLQEVRSLGFLVNMQNLQPSI
jgi:hypothetical protein